MKLTTYILLLIHCTAIFIKLVPLVDYHVNYELYAEKLCINKDRPELACEGKCVLMQKLKATEEQDNTATNRQLTVAFVLGFLPPSDVSIEEIALETDVYHYATVPTNNWTNRPWVPPSLG